MFDVGRRERGGLAKREEQKENNGAGTNGRRDEGENRIGEEWLARR